MPQLNPRRQRVRSALGMFKTETNVVESSTSKEGYLMTHGIRVHWYLGQLALAALLGSVPPVMAQAAPTTTDVYVLATLYRRHQTTPAYDHATLRRAIMRIAPEVVVLDVSPRELREQQVHPSKAEYPEVIFPLVKERGYRAYPGEPDEPVFTEVVQKLGASLKAFHAEHAEKARADKAYEEATWAALGEMWKAPADVNSEATDRLLAARRAYQDRLAGPAVADAWRRWNEHAVTMVHQAARENPGKRILVLIGVENTAALRTSLGNAAGVRLVDMEAWLGREGK